MVQNFGLFGGIPLGPSPPPEVPNGLYGQASKHVRHNARERAKTLTTLGGRTVTNLRHCAATRGYQFDSQYSL